MLHPHLSEFSRSAASQAVHRAFDAICVRIFVPWIGRLEDLLSPYTSDTVLVTHFALLAPKVAFLVNDGLTKAAKALLDKCQVM